MKSKSKPVSNQIMRFGHLRLRFLPILATKHNHIQTEEENEKEETLTSPVWPKQVRR